MLLFTRYKMYVLLALCKDVALGSVVGVGPIVKNHFVPNFLFSFRSNDTPKAHLFDSLIYLL